MKNHAPARRTWRLALAGAIALVCAVASWAIAGFERTLGSGQVVLLELAPVDPRSLMQGDYMALRFAADDQLRQRTGASPSAVARAPGHIPAYAYLALDEQLRASLADTGDTLPAPEGRIAMRIRMRGGRLTLGPNAFFFQEGTAKAYENAKWGEFHVAPDGKALLTGLRDANLYPIHPQTEAGDPP